MKKIIVMAVLAMLAMNVPAASFIWTSGNTTALRVQFGSGTYVAATAYLVYLGNGAASWNVADYVVNNTQVATSAALATGRFSATYAASIAGGELDQGDVFGTYVTYFDTVSGKTWYNISSTTYAVPSDATDVSTLASYTSGGGFNYGITGEGESLAVGGGWVAVPEPASAALALAGLAMLIRRRK